MAIVVVNSNDTSVSTESEVTLAAGAVMSMRMWRNEQPHNKTPHRSPYETLGYVVAGSAELTIEGETVHLSSGMSYLVPVNAEHTYKIIESFTAVECTSPPQQRPIDFTNKSGITMPQGQ